MKAIRTTSVWKDGVLQNATQLTLTITFDNLDTEAVFSYVLSDDDNNALTNGLLPISGSDYEQWGLSIDANTDAYVYVANALNLQLI